MKKIILFLGLLSIFSLSGNSIVAGEYICIDPGHGGIHSGTVGRVYGVLEKDVNLGVGYTAWTYFGLADYNPNMTRYEDTTLTRRVFGHFDTAGAPRVYIDSLEGANRRGNGCWISGCGRKH